jgi:hypothetical protein
MLQYKEALHYQKKQGLLPMDNMPSPTMHLKGKKGGYMGFEELLCMTRDQKDHTQLYRCCPV